MTMIMTGGEMNGSFVLTGHDESGALQRWSTNVVQSDSIVIRLDISNDEGKTWRSGARATCSGIEIDPGGCLA
jgi:hypothetical protein